MTSTLKTALVLGATGGIGGEVARQLVRAGWQVRGLRRTEGAAGKDGLTWFSGDAMNRQDVLRAAAGVDVIVHAVNPPGYQRWAELVLPMLDNTIAAAQANGARIVLPGTVYNFGPDVFPVILEGAAQNPQTRKGQIRAEMERRLQAASSRGARVLIVRAGDFFGPRSGNNWLAQGLIKTGKPVKRISNPSRPGASHQWAYLPDVAQTMVRLLQKEADLAAFASYHFAGFQDADGTQFASAIQRVVAAQTGVKPGISQFPWWLIRVASPFVAVFKEMLEMRYLWEQSIRMDNHQLLAELGQEPHTPIDEAIKASLEGLGCLPAASAQAALPTSSK